MPFDRFLIANYNTGLQTNLRPWIINDDAWFELYNAYVFRGRIRKRFGSIYMGDGIADNPLYDQLYSRLRINLGTATSGTAPGTIWQPGQMFSVGDDILTVVTAGVAQTLLTTGAVTGTFDTTDGAYVFTGVPGGTPIYYYPALPVMGFGNYEIGPINNQPLFGFDTQFAYQFNVGTGWQRSGSGVTPIWTGNNLNFFWTTNWRGTTSDVTTFFVSNYNSAAGNPVIQDPLWSYNGTWTIFKPYFLPAGGAPMTGPFVQTALIILAFKNRLILLNTIEYNGTVNQVFVNRCRYSFIGSPFAVNAWYERGQVDSGGNVAAGAGFTDATTEEAIVSAEFIKDRLIVYFDRSTWELVYTGNQVEPFVWQKINTELGSESTFSTVPFDKVILTIGNTGVHACNGANVERIDNNIPELIFEVQDHNESENRVAGIRDYFTEMVYWTFPSDNDSTMYPNQVLVYNYKTGAWALNDDSITAWGYYEQQGDTNWEDTTTTWNQSNFTWISGIIQAQFRQVVGGNQEGYTFIISPDVTRNAGVLQITNFDTDNSGIIELIIIDHNLSINDYIYLESLQGITNFTPIITQVITITDTNTIFVATGFATNYGGLYSGGGTAARVSEIYMVSKQFNPYIDKAQDVFISKIDFGVKKTELGQITVDYYPSSTTLSMIDEGFATGAIMGTGVLETSPYDPIYYPLEQQQERLWHSLYFQSSGECIQLAFYMSFDQMTNPDISLVDFQLEGMILYTNPTGRLE